MAIALLNAHDDPLRWPLGRYRGFNVIRDGRVVELDTDVTWGCSHSSVLARPQEHLPPPSSRWES